MPKYIPILLLALIAGFISYVALAPVGEKAPSVSIQTINGEDIALDSLQAPALITFWATTCSTCIEEMPHLVALQDKLAPRGLKTIGVAMSYDDLAAIKKLVEARQLNYDIAYDSDHKIATAFGGVKATPKTLLINPEGRIVMNQLGYVDFEKLEQRIEEML